MIPVIIGRVTYVQPHPNSDTLDVVAIRGKINVANRPSSGQPRYQVGDYAVMLVENLILPEWLLKHLDLWNAEKGKGYLAGSKGNRTKGRSIAGIPSEVALCKVDYIATQKPYGEDFVIQHMTACLAEFDQPFSSVFARVAKRGSSPLTPEGIDVAWMLGIEEYVPA